MTIIDSISLRLRRLLRGIQAILSFESWSMYPQFNSSQGLGRVALLACCLGIALGVHLVVLILVLCEQANLLSFTSTDVHPFLDADRMKLVFQWCAYIIFVCTFHLAEFFATAVCNPLVASSDSFVVNHSHAYTAAAIVSAKGLSHLL